MNAVLFVNSTIGFSENLFLVTYNCVFAKCNYRVLVNTVCVFVFVFVRVCVCACVRVCLCFCKIAKKKLT